MLGSGGQPLRLGLVGAGIGASLSPALHEREAAHHGLECTYELRDLGSADPATAVPAALDAAQAAGWRGLNVTHPAKRVALEHVDDLSPEAAALGAVNTVLFEPGRRVGHNTDWSGFAEGFRRGLPGAALRRVVVLGAGGAGGAVAFALLRLGAAEVVVIDADDAAAERLAAELASVADGGVDAAPLDGLAGTLTDADGLAHATPTGMVGHPGSAVDGDRLHPGLWVADVVYRPLETQLLRDARERGCRTLDGGGMAVFQAVHAFELFTGIAPDAERMLATFAGELEREAHA